jgi:hypothetical protein
MGIILGAFGDRTMKDPVDEGIHKYRDENARKFNFELTAIFEDLREQSRNLEVIRLSQKKIVPKKI